MTAPSSSPPNPGVGSTGNTRWPSATRRVGVTGRECHTSSSASNMTDLLDVRSQQVVQFRGDRLRFVDIRFVAVDKSRGQLVGELAHALPQAPIDTVRRAIGIGDRRRAEQLLETIGVERI